MSDPNQEIETMHDGVMMTIALVGGTTERVKVRKVPLREMDLLAAAWGRQPAEIAVYCDKPAEWVEKLSDDGWLAIMREGRRLNKSPFKEWFGFQNEAMSALGPRADQLMAAAAKKVSET